LENAIKTDTDYQTYLKNPPADFVVRDGFLYYEPDDRARALYVPDNKELKQKIIRACHDSPYAGHMGRDRTLALARRYYFWPDMATYVKEYCKRCPICQLHNPGNKRRAAPLKPIPPAGAPFRELTMDFVTVTKSKRGFDSVLVVVCRFSKYVIYIKTTKDVDGPEAARLYIQQVLRALWTIIGLSILMDLLKFSRMKMLTLFSLTQLQST